MAIKSIHVSNFKTFKDVDISLGMFNVLIGPNACGKSNFVDLLRFLRDITSDGLRNAISLQGGVDDLTNKRTGPSGGLSVRVVADDPVGYAWPADKGLVGFRASHSEYEFELQFSEEEPRTRVAKDILTLDGAYVKLEQSDAGKIGEAEKYGEGRNVISVVDGVSQFSTPILPDGVPPEIARRKPWPESLDYEVPPDALMAQMPSLLHLLWSLQCSVYDFDPKLPKRSVSVSGKRELEEDGSNLAIVLNSISGDREKKRKFSNLVRDLLPFVEDVDIQRQPDKSLLFRMQEAYAPEYLPAFLMSDGTVNITALVVALYFESGRRIVLEEPERNIHPSLIRRVVAMMKDASATKQIIVTTHSPEIVKHADLEDLILISRGPDGFSTVTKPAEQEEVKAFLRDDIGIDDLYVGNLLRA